LLGYENYHLGTRCAFYHAMKTVQDRAEFVVCLLAAIILSVIVAAHFHWSFKENLSAKLRTPFVSGAEQSGSK
jgi:hypothetical protein